MKKLVVIAVLFLMSLLALFKAPVYYLWLLAIAVTEFPLIFALIVVIGLLAVIWLQRFQKVYIWISIITLLIFLSPIIRAYRVADSLDGDFNKAFGIKGDTVNTKAPGYMIKVISGPAEKQVAYISYEYKPNLSLDMYTGLGKGKRPCVIMVHGGSWSSGNSQQLPELNSHLAQRGYSVAAVNYRLAPNYKSPAQIADLADAVSYLCKNAGKLNLDTTKFIIMGRSAGAQIALLYAYTQHQPGIKGAIDFYGPADMVWGYSVPASKLVMDSRAVMERYLGGSYKQVPQAYKASSPIEFVSKTTIPTLIVHGDNDVLVSPLHSVRLSAKLQQFGVKHYYLELPWATHGFDYNLNGPGGQLSTYAVERFLHEVCK